MSDTRFSVQLPEIAETVRRLAEVEHQLGTATKRVEKVGHAQAGDVTPALEHFADHWELGLHRLHQHVGELHAALSAAHSGYASHEAALESQFTEGSSGGHG